MGAQQVDVVTGAFGYSGKYITQRLLCAGRQVKTLTGHPGRPNPFGAAVTAMPFHFDRPDLLAASLEGVDTLYNTYWIRFAHGAATYERAVQNTRILFHAARRAGVRRVVHVSITRADSASPLPYFRGKGQLEEALRESGLSHAIVRPTVIFGPEDILINNIAWLLRRFPVFAIPGSGEYPLQPIFVEDMAGLAIAAAQRQENLTLDAVGPETYTFRDLVDLIARTTGSRAWRFRTHPWLALTAARAIGRLVGDVVLTRDEVDGLMAGLLVSDAPATGTTSLRQWLREHAASVGARYASELNRHYR